MKHLWLSLLVASASFAARADIVVPMTLVDENGLGAPVGNVTISETAYGLVFTPSLAQLQPGLHGFHVHEKPSCAPGEKDGKKVPALGAGEPSTVPIAAAIGNAIFDATGARMREVPFTPKRVLAALKATKPA